MQYIYIYKPRNLGWEGKGLGQTGQGIIDPVRASEIRQNDEKYIG